MPDKIEKDPELPQQADTRYRLQEAEVRRGEDQTAHVMIQGQEVSQCMPIGTLGYDIDL